MATVRTKFTFVEQLIKEPIIWKLAKDFEVITNIRRADVTDERGWVILELEGDQDEIGCNESLSRRRRAGREAPA